MSAITETTVAAKPVGERKISRLSIASWVIYDLANTIYSMAIVSLYFSLWVRDQVGPASVDRIYGITMAISMAIIFVVSPLLGSLTDQARRRMPFLITSTLICVGFTALLGRFDLYLTLAIFIVSNIAYQATVQFYDALLPEVSTEENRGTISGIGVGVGYLGSYIGVGTGLFMTSYLGYDVVAVFPVVAALFLLFALPCFFFVKERGNPRAQPFSLDSVRRAFAQTADTFRHARQFPGLVRFLVGRVFYTDAVNTVIAIMSIYVVNQVVTNGTRAAEASGLSGAALEQARADLEAQGDTQAQIILLGAITFSVLGGFAWGRLVDKIGAKKTLDMVLLVWIGTALLAALVGLLHLPIWVFYLVAALAGIGFGGLWAADRPLMLILSPPARIGEFYGLYGMVGRFAAITGPLLWALIVGTLLAGQPYAQSVGVLVLMVMLIISFFILRPVTDEPRNWSPEERGEA
jgi:UMF1 family MFS transporter